MSLPMRICCRLTHQHALHVKEAVLRQQSAPLERNEQHERSRRCERGIELRGMPKRFVLMDGPRESRRFSVAALRERTADPPDRFTRGERHGKKVARRPADAELSFRIDDREVAADDAADERFSRYAAEGELCELDAERAAEDPREREERDDVGRDRAAFCHHHERDGPRAVRQKIKDYRGGGALLARQKKRLLPGRMSPSS